jgi:hypothetical protein
MRRLDAQLRGNVMSTVTFDTLKFVETLKKSGFDDDKAKAIATAYQDASTDQELLTKKDLEMALQKELAPIKMEQQVHKYMLGMVLGGILALILKTFF